MKFLVTMLFFVIGGICKSADISFVVYHSKGSVAKSSSKALLKKGDKIYLQETLVLGDKATIILVCSNYKFIQINKKGNYRVKSLLNQCNKNQPSYSSSYFKYVWDQLTHPQGNPEKDPGEYMKNVGAVSRGCNLVSTNLQLDTLHYVSGNLPVYWKSTFKSPQARIYKVELDGAAIIKKTLTQNDPVYAQELFASLNAGEYYWQITEEDGNSCERNYLKIWAAADYKKEVSRILLIVPVTRPAETAWLKGFIMEENFFLAEALQYYQQASNWEPKNKLYKKSFKKFYEKNF